jgi:endo-1,4-beta-xylanase
MLVQNVSGRYRARNSLLRTIAASASIAVLGCTGSINGDGPDSSTTSGATGGGIGSGAGGSVGTGAGGQTGTGTGGATGIGGATGAAGASGTGGRGGATGTGGARGTGGRAGTGGTTGTGGMSGAGGTTGGAGAGGITKFVGNISTSGAIRTGFVTYWNQFSPENEGKWGSVQPAQGTFNWAALDREYAYAQTNNIIFKEHNFIWGNQQPAWVNSGNAQSAVQAWMNAFCQRYPNTRLIDVVNEPPPHTTPAYISGIGGTGASGYDWIVNAFKWARAACPNAILILNDFNTIELTADNNRIIDIANRVKAAGGPIDAVGAQGHGAYQIATSTVKGFIDKITQQTGLPVYITEYDINVADDTQQRNIMQDQFTMFWNDANVKGITLWGYIVGATWLPNTGLQQTNGTMRPAMAWLMTFLGR